MINNESIKTVGDYLQANNMNMKELSVANNTTYGEFLNLTNRGFDTNNPEFFKTIQLMIYNQACKTGNAKVVEKIKQNMVTSPETIGLSKDNPCLDGIEQGIKAIENAYGVVNNLENTQARTR